MSDYDRFGPYTIYECLGAGGMASVHHATVVAAAGTTDVALKRLLPQLAEDKAFVDAFIREAKLAAQLHHPNIVRILELGRIGRTYYIAMELVRGHSLQSVMKKARVAGQLAPIGVVVSLMIELCDVLDYVTNSIDENGEPLRVVHRDLTPGNLMVVDDGHLKVIDFGVAKAMAGRFVTNTGLIKGKLGYMSVEALAGEPLDQRADLFSAGVVMWELLAGKRLFSGKDERELIQRVRTARIQPPSRHNPNCPIELDEITMRALERDRDERWQTASAIREALEEVRRYYGAHATPQGVTKWKRKLRRESSMTPRPEPDESTSQRLSTNDLEELLDDDSAPVELAPEPPPIDPHHDFHEPTHDEIGVKIFFHSDD